MKHHRRAFVLFTLLLTALAVHGQGLETAKLSIPNADTVNVSFPATWQKEIRQLPPGASLKLRTDGASLQIAFLAVRENQFSIQQEVDAAVTKACQQYVANSVEQRVTLTQLTSAHGHGSYATFTDAKLANTTTLSAGQYKSVSSGVLVVGKQLAIFTLLSNDRNSRDYLQAMQVVTDGISVTP